MRNENNPSYSDPLFTAVRDFVYALMLLKIDKQKKHKINWKRWRDLKRGYLSSK